MYNDSEVHHQEEHQQPEQAQQQQQAKQAQKPNQTAKNYQQNVDDIPQCAEVITVEVCENCQEHAWCTQHDESKYHGIFLQIKAQLESHPDHKLYVLRNVNPQNLRQKIQPQRGAFEIKHNGVCIYSKIKSTLFPNPAVINERITKFFQDKKEGGDLTKYANSVEKKLQPPPKKRDMAAIYGTYYVAIQNEQQRLEELRQEEERQRIERERLEEERRIKQEEEEEAERIRRQEEEEKQRLEQEELERQQREQEEEDERRRKEEEQQLAQQAQYEQEQQQQEQQQHQQQEHQEQVNHENQHQKKQH
ncbi:hypothetical protein ABPG72_013767 [Tetrahymena utriculariae]